ncbi:hypothetical protein [Cochleicola gelatinilyticus]|uniref:Uncharacterized protein n=1 Tax=Cochleicola gelatinilyticus TaxID=1763537 RepID=A0A167HT40_9FLAO|nr:hypothetical protein [Cochleicola gelatinilyticus]OAB78937.1 hypothetical protein ULVI_10190 [Cochleicola gelatinilyticus]
MIKFTIPASKNIGLNTLILVLSTASTFAQVGINTLEPKATLDVNGTMRVQDLPTKSGNFLLTTDSDGFVSKFKSYLLYDVIGDIAEYPVELTLNGNETVDNLNLGLSSIVVIPPFVEAKVIINYSVPVGTALQNYPPSTYVGIRFIKQGVEMEEGSRKVTLVSEETGSNNNISNMNTISNIYIETFAPSSEERIFNYEIQGYIEQYVESGNDPYEYRFSMWDNTGPNYNWGRATLTSQIYIK